MLPLETGARRKRFLRRASRHAPFLSPARAATVVDRGHRRKMDLAVEVPSSPLEAVMSHEVWAEIYQRLVRLIDEHRTTLITVNTRRGDF